MLRRNLSTLETLKAARELISTPDRWTKQAYARLSATSPEVMPNEEGASCWCSTGAIAYVQGFSEPFFDASFENAFDREIEELESFNDSPVRTHAEVLAEFDAAIAREAARHA